MFPVAEVFVTPSLVLSAPGLPEAARRVCLRYALGGYLTVSTLLNAVSDEDLGELLEWVSASREAGAKPTALRELCQLMALHEGLVAGEDDSCAAWLDVLGALLQAEVLVRRGLVELHYARVTLECLDPRSFVYTAKARARYDI